MAAKRPICPFLTWIFGREAANVSVFDMFLAAKRPRCPFSTCFWPRSGQDVRFWERFGPRSGHGVHFWRVFAVKWPKTAKVSMFDKHLIHEPAKCPFLKCYWPQDNKDRCPFWLVFDCERAKMSILTSFWPWSGQGVRFWRVFGKDARGAALRSKKSWNCCENALRAALTENPIKSQILLWKCSTRGPAGQKII